MGIPLMAAATEAKGHQTIGEYISRWQETIAEKVACRPIYKLCVEGEWMLGTIRMVRWRDQDVVNEPEELTKIMRNLT